MHFLWELRSRLEVEEKREQPWEPLAPRPWGQADGQDGSSVGRMSPGHPGGCPAGR